MQISWNEFYKQMLCELESEQKYIYLWFNFPLTVSSSSWLVTTVMWQRNEAHCTELWVACQPGNSTWSSVVQYSTIKTQFIGKCQWHNYETIIALKSVKCHRLTLRCQQSDKMHRNLTREIHLLTTMLNPTANNKVSDIKSWGKLCKYEINHYDSQYEWVSEWVGFTVPINKL